MRAPRARITVIQRAACAIETASVIRTAAAMARGSTPSRRASMPSVSLPRMSSAISATETQSLTMVFSNLLRRLQGEVSVDRDSVFRAHGQVANLRLREPSEPLRLDLPVALFPCFAISLQPDRVHVVVQEGMKIRELVRFAAPAPPDNAQR